MDSRQRVPRAFDRRGYHSIPVKHEDTPEVTPFQWTDRDGANIINPAKPSLLETYSCPDAQSRFWFCC